MESQNSVTDSFGGQNSESSMGLDAARYYLSKSVKNSTKQQYDRVYDVWRDFCQRNELEEFGAIHEQLAACLSLVMMRDKSYSKVVMLSAAVTNEYRIRMLPSPTTHETISTLFRGLRNEHPQTRTAKVPSYLLLKKFFTSFITTSTKLNMKRDGLRASVVLWRTIWRISMEYHTLGRFSDIVKLRRSDVKYVTDPSPHLRILFKGGKNDLYTEGAERVVASNPTVKRCPVQLTLNYFKYLGTSYIGYLVPSCLAKNFPNPDKSVPYSGALADMKKLMDSLGYDGKLYGEHSGKEVERQPKQPMVQLTNNSNVFEAGFPDAMPAKYVDLSIPSRLSMSELLQKNQNDTNTV